MRTDTEVRLALPSAKPSLPRGLLRGEPPNIPKNRQRFFEKFPFLSFSYTWKNRREAYAITVRGRPSRGTAYASGIWHPPHHPTPKSLMSVKFLAEVYLSCIQEHENVVKEMVRTNAQGLERPHCQFTLICFLAQKHVKVNC